ncbi:MAG: NADH-quinone oxidoreductase subunit A [Sulfolobales archaeon]
MVDIYAVAIIVLLVVVSLLIPLIAHYISIAISPEIEYVMKRERFESGNPRSGRSRGFFIMQYYPFLLMFSSLEPLIVLLVFILISPHELLNLITYAVLVSFIIILPILYFAYKFAEDLSLWREE